MLEIVIDIETVPPPMTETAKLELAFDKVPKTYKKKEAIEKWVLDNCEETYQRLALDHHRALVVAIGLQVPGGHRRVFVADNDYMDVEEELFQRFNVWVERHRNKIQWIGHNIAGFDMPMLFKRAVKYGHCAIARATYMSKPWDAHIVDTMLLWPGRDWSRLDDIAEFLGIERTEAWEEDAGHHGQQIRQWWHDGEVERIRAACGSDVELTAKVAQRLRDIGGVW